MRRRSSENTLHTTVDEWRRETDAWAEEVYHEVSP